MTLKISWPGQWLQYLAAVVSICEYTVSNKGGLLCHCHDYGRSWGLCPHALYFVGATTWKIRAQPTKGGSLGMSDVSAQFIHALPCMFQACTTYMHETCKHAWNKWDVYHACHMHEQCMSYDMHVTCMVYAMNEPCLNHACMNGLYIKFYARFMQESCINHSCHVSAEKEKPIVCCTCTQCAINH